MLWLMAGMRHAPSIPSGCGSSPKPSRQSSSSSGLTRGNDRIDACRIAHFAATVAVVPIKRDKMRERLDEMVTTRQFLMNRLIAARNHATLLRVPALRTALTSASGSNYQRRVSQSAGRIGIRTLSRPRRPCPATPPTHPLPPPTPHPPARHPGRRPAPCPAVHHRPCHPPRPMRHAQAPPH
jgi:hypothetical protein